MQATGTSALQWTSKRHSAATMGRDVTVHYCWDGDRLVGSIWCHPYRYECSLDSGASYTAKRLDDARAWIEGNA